MGLKISVTRDLLRVLNESGKLASQSERVKKDPALIDAEKQNCLGSTEKKKVTWTKEQWEKSN